MTSEAASTLVTMYDSANAALLPGGADRYAAYVNGRYANLPAVRARFPHARVYGIDVIGDAWLQARILDFEPGDAQSADTLRNFVRNRESYKPHTSTIYCDRAELAEVEDILGDLWHVIWLATLDGTRMTGQRTEAGNLIIGTQWAGGLHAPFDTSDTLERWK